MTMYVAAYDTESPQCLAACRRIVEVHRLHRMPATFFLVGKVLEANPDEYRELLSDELFEVASHGYAHRMMADHPICGPAASPEERREEVLRGKECVERVFGRPCLGYRTAVGFIDGLRSTPDAIPLVAGAGLRYVSSLLWGPDYSLPAQLVPPFRYAEAGAGNLWELPGHGWHENLLKDHNRWGPKRLCLFPPYMPEAVPPGYLRSAEEEFAVANRPFIDRAVAEKCPYVSLVWHPWSLGRFDPEMRMLDITFRYVRELGLPVGRFADVLAALTRAP